MEDLTFVSTIAIFAAFAVTGITLYVLSQPEDNPNQDNNSNMSKRKNAHIESPKNTKSSKQSHHYLQSSPSTTPTTTSKGTSRY